VVTYKSWQPKLLLSGPAASLWVPPNCGTVYQTLVLTICLKMVIIICYFLFLS